jgi:hypothetical protein
MTSRILFESPILFSAVWFPLQVALLVVWSKTRTTSTGRLVWVGLGLLPTVLVIQKFVTTQREQIIERCQEMALLVENGNLPAIGSCLAPEFAAEGLDADAFLERIEHTLARYSVENARLTRFAVTFDAAGEALADFVASGNVRDEESILDRVTARFIVTFRRCDNGWMVARVELRKSALSPFDSLRQMMP